MATAEGFVAQGLLPPPSGVQQDFIHGPSQAHHLINAAIVCPILAAVFIVARCAARTLSGAWGWDDYTAIIGLAFSITESAISIVSTRYGNGRHVWDVMMWQLTPYLKYTYAETLVYAIGIYVIKLSLLILFYRVFAVNKYFKWAIWTVVGIWTLYTVISFPIAVFQCTPVHKAWNLAAEGHCRDLVTIGVASGYFNIITDVFIILLPAPMVWTLHLSTRIRLGIMAIFATGAFVIATTIVRQVEVLESVGSTDFTWFTSNSLMWLIIEMNVSIICACMPTLKPLLRKITRRGDTKKRKSKPSAYAYNSNSNSGSRSTAKVPKAMKSRGDTLDDGDTLMDASYIELGPAGTNRDVHIAANESPEKEQWQEQGGGIIKTDTIGQAVHYKGGEDSTWRSSGGGSLPYRP